MNVPQINENGQLVNVISQPINGNVQVKNNNNNSNYELTIIFTIMSQVMLKFISDKKCSKAKQYTSAESTVK